MTHHFKFQYPTHYIFIISLYLEVFRELSIKVNNLVDLKQQQEREVNCLVEGRECFLVIPTAYAKRFVFQQEP